MNRILLIGWGIISFLLLFYSYTQVDLSLTLTGGSLIANIQHAFQYVGWFNRPLSTYLYIGILILLTTSFLWTIKQIVNKNLGAKSLFKVIYLIAGILLFSYIAFSYDMFNYIFDAKIVTFYRENPYLFKALDFPNDPMLSFMRSTHRVYPYGPTWLLLTVPISFIGFNIFTITFFLFKAMSAVSYVACAHLIYKIAKKLDLKSPILPVALFAFNPLVIIESLVSSHNEIVMMAFALLSVNLLLSNKRSLSIGSLIISIGTKYTTVFLLPIYILGFINKKYLAAKFMVPIATILMVIAVIVTAASSGQNKNPEFQPWYLLSLAPFIVMYENIIVRSLFIGASIVVLFSYIPFLWSGSWPVDIVSLKVILLGAGIGLGAIGIPLTAWLSKK